MELQYPHVDKTIELLTDLITINNDRIACYQSALGKFPKLDTDLRDFFYSTISEAIRYRQQLNLKITQMNRDVKSSRNILGKIYRAWNDFKITLVYNTPKAILSSCLFNEKIALNSYKAALNMDIGISKEVLTLLKEQEDGLKMNYELLKNYSDIGSMASASLNYLR